MALPKIGYLYDAAKWRVMRDPKKKTAAPTPTEAILESISDGVVTVDRAWRISSFNRAAETFRDLSPRRKPPWWRSTAGPRPKRDGRSRPNEQ